MKRLDPMTPHAALVEGGHDDRARQDFAFSLRNLVTSKLMPATRTLYDTRARQRWADANGRQPQSPDEIRAAMDADPWYRFYLSARRTSQELIWASVIPAVEAAEPPAPPPRAGGSLVLDPGVKAPAYVGAIDIHCMPGGYLADRGEGDMAAGAVYDRGVHLYMSGLMGPANDAVGQLAARWLSSARPDFAPRRILDMGCAVGHATLPWAAVYPQAELHGIDVGAALLRYAHLRAESLGVAAHFRQANAEATPFPDGHFDLVASSIMLHETSARGLPAILAESFRLLAPGGIILHVDQPRFDDEDPWATFLQENETHYNNEPFWRRYRRTDLAEAARAAGFAEVRLETLKADVVRQSQNNGAAPRRGAPGFLALMAVK
jgi:SAM-dependent methyltransferase